MIAPFQFCHPSIILLIAFLFSTCKKNGKVDAAPNRPPFRVLGGKDARHWPFIARIILHQTKDHSDKGDQLCGGTLISDRIVMTAAHCILHVIEGKLYTLLPPYIRVVLGDYRQDATDSHEISARVLKTVTHSEYSDGRLENDIALLYLSDPIPCIRERTPAQLPLLNGANLSLAETWNTRQDPIGQMECNMIGWGPTLQDTKMNRLGELKIHLIDHVSCGKLAEQQMFKGLDCMITPKGENLTMGCSGDSGGPIVCKSGTNWKLTAVVNTGLECTNQGQIHEYKNVVKQGPIMSYHADVSHFMPWVYTQLKQDDMLEGFIQNQKKCEKFSLCSELCNAQ